MAASSCWSTIFALEVLLPHPGTYRSMENGEDLPPAARGTSSPFPGPPCRSEVEQSVEQSPAALAGHPVLLGVVPRLAELVALTGKRGRHRVDGLVDEGTHVLGGLPRVVDEAE